MTTASVSARPLTAPPQLTPALSPRTALLLDEGRLLHQLVEGFGSPLNLVLPRQVVDNLTVFQERLRRERVSHCLFMAHKANRSAALVRAAALTDCGLDVASTGELCSALSAGFTGDRLEATGPKPPDFIRLAVQHGVLLNVDSVAELGQIAELSRRLAARLRPRVLLRMTGFPGQSSPGRFGVHLKMAEEALELCRRIADRVELHGFAFHLSCDWRPPPS